jgi:hypothetical protein
VRLASLLACLAAAVLVTGCGGSAREAVQLESVAQAATLTAEAGSSRFELRMTMDAGGQSVAVDASGAFDFAGSRGRMTMEAGQLGGTFELRLDGTVMYMRMPEGLGMALPGGKRWLKVDLEGLGALAGAELGGLTQLQRQQSPAQLLDFLKAVEGDVEQLGEEEVRGVATTRYRGTIDLQKALEAQLEALPEEQREALALQLEQALRAAAPDGELSVDVWADAEGRVRRAAMELVVPGAPGGAAAVAITMDLFDFGVEVDVEPPPDAEVLDLAALGSLFGS